MAEREQICPACQGIGLCDIFDESLHNAITAAKAEEIKKLVAAGYSIREIMLQCGFKSPRSVTYLRDKKLED